MSDKLKLTDNAVDRWLRANRKKNEVLRDTQVEGFHVRVINDSPQGELAVASYCIDFRVSSTGKKRRLKVASFKERTVSQARKLAGDRKSEGRSGIDVIKDREHERTLQQQEKDKAANALPTIQSWFDSTHRDHLYERDDTGKRRINYLEKDWLPALGHLTAPELNIKTISNQMKAILDDRAYGQDTKPLRESTAKKYLEYFKEACSAYCAQHECPNPLNNLKWATVKKTGKLTFAEIKDNEHEGSPRTKIPQTTFIVIVKELESLYKESENLLPLALLFMAYSGLRPSDIVTLQWSHLKLEGDSPYLRKVLIKSKHIKSSPTIIPLHSDAVATLKKAEKHRVSDFVFSDNMKAKNTQSLNYWWDKVRENSEFDFPPYQLRHNVAHRIIDAGGTIVNVAAVLGNTVEVCIRNYLNTDLESTAELLRSLKF
ncbi:integrase family protein [Oceanicoccus sagamiensis]|uniref:Tyr recombinase domain-containing protein n=1 Tax=Oceanicoccus sagamiensis TaxID=716816 RepID=A0A1X9NAU1_9GAMM|nr:integrase family protein [Oceanicoccus sagamiensis]ARN73552.1 hypothetical protein BST96_05115 [Oceanicoccus sagamiensis]